MKIKCDYCNGYGWYIDYDIDSDEEGNPIPVPVRELCRNCNGLGVINSKE